jgi:hypothetical protein
MKITSVGASLVALLIAGCSSKSIVDASAPVDGGDADAGALDGAADVDAGFMDAGVVAVPLRGCLNSPLVDVTIGGQTFTLSMDTGSSTLAVAAQGCSGCTGVSPLYAPSTNATDLHETVSSEYGTGNNGWSGEGYSDIVRVNGISTRVSFSAIQSSDNFFFATTCPTPTGTDDASYQGIIGFGPDAILVKGTTSYFNSAASAGAIADTFAVELCNNGGTLWLGGYDPMAVASPVQYTPMTQKSLYAVSWEATSVGTSSSASPIVMPASAAESLIDSGGEELDVPDAAFTAITSALEADASVSSILGPKWFSTTTPQFSNCLTPGLTPAQIDAALPPLIMHLAAGVDVTLNATESYLAVLYDGAGNTSYCQALLDSTSTGLGDTLTYLGQSIMRGHVAVFDPANHRLGIARGPACGS